MPWTPSGEYGLCCRRRVNTVPCDKEYGCWSPGGRMKRLPHTEQLQAAVEKQAYPAGQGSEIPWRRIGKRTIRIGPGAVPPSVHIGRFTTALLWMKGLYNKDAAGDE